MSTRAPKNGPCIFCRIVSGELDSATIFEDERLIAFLDHSPLFRGHVLLVPKIHVVTLAELPRELIDPLFTSAQELSRAVERAMGAEGTFVAMNNKVSQSVPHLHVHVVPRKKGDGLRGFFWPRTKYASKDDMADVARAIAGVLGVAHERE